MSVDAGALLAWCQRNTSGYENVDVDSFGECWRDGLAFCALIHKFHPEKIDFPSLSPSNNLENLQLAFKVGLQLGISHRMDAKSFLSSPSLDSDSISSYLSHYYNTFHITQLMNYTRIPLMSDSLSSSSLLDKVNSTASLSHAITGSPNLSPSHSLSSSPSLSSPLSSLSISADASALTERIHSVSFIPTSPNEEFLLRSPSPLRLKKYPDTNDSEGKKKEKEDKPKTKAKEKEKEKPKSKPKEKEKDTKTKAKTTPTKTVTKSASPKIDKKDKTKTDKADKAAKIQRPPSNLKMRKSPSTIINNNTPATQNTSNSKTPRTARSVSAPPARPPSATPGKTPRKENKTPRTPATPTPRNASPRKGTPKVEKEKTKSKKDRPVTPSAKADSVMSDSASDRIRTLEIENSQLKAKLNEYKSMCESLELRLNNEMELRKKVVQQLQGFKMPED